VARNKPATPRRRAPRYAESTRRSASAAEVRASCAGEHVAMELQARLLSRRYSI
jgi:hypothetical protein